MIKLFLSWLALLAVPLLAMDQPRNVVFVLFDDLSESDNVAAANQGIVEHLRACLNHPWGYRNRPSLSSLVLDLRAVFEDEGRGTRTKDESALHF